MLQNFTCLIAEAATAAEQAALPAEEEDPEEEAPEAAETLDAAEDRFKRILEILDQRIAAQKQAEDLHQQQVEQQQSSGTAGEGETADAVTKSTSSSSSSGWSAGGFLDDQDVIDSGSDSADDSPPFWVHPSSRTDWGLEQYDEDVTEHLEWYGGKQAQEQLRRAEKAAAEATAAIEGEVAAAIAAERGMEAVGHVGTAAAPEHVAVAAGCGSSSSSNGVGSSAEESVGSSGLSSSEQAAVAAGSKSADDASS